MGRRCVAIPISLCRISLQLTSERKLWTKASMLLVTWPPCHRHHLSHHHSSPSPPILTLIPSLACSLTDTLTHSHTHSHTHTLTHSLTHSHTYSLPLSPHTERISGGHRIGSDSRIYGSIWEGNQFLNSVLVTLSISLYSTCTYKMEICDFITC